MKIFSILLFCLPLLADRKDDQIADLRAQVRVLRTSLEIEQATQAMLASATKDRSGMRGMLASNYALLGTINLQMEGISSALEAQGRIERKVDQNANAAVRNSDSIQKNADYIIKIMSWIIGAFIATATFVIVVSLKTFLKPRPADSGALLNG